VTIEKTAAKGELFADKLQAHQQQLDGRLAAFEHYDRRLENMDNEVAGTRRLAHEFRDLLKKDLYEQDRRINLLEEKVDFEVEKVTVG
jgi:hypothetical protein